MDKKKLLLLSLGHLSCDVNGGALPALLPYVRSGFGLDYQATGGLMLAYSCLSSVIQPIFGLLTDRFKQPWFIPLGILLAGLGIGAIGFMGGYWGIFMAIAVSGIGAALFHPEGARNANIVSGRSKGIGLSFFSIGGNSGFVLGPLLVTASMACFGLAGTALFGVLATLTAGLLLWEIVHLGGFSPKRADAGAALADAPREGADPAAAEADGLAAATASRPRGRNNWREFSRLTVVVVSRSILFLGFNTFIPLWWISVYGQSAAQGGLALAFFCVCGVIFNVIGGYFSDRFGPVNIIRLSYVILPPAVIAFSLCGSVSVAYCLLPVIALSLYAPFSSLVVLGQRLLARNIGFASGVTLGLATTMGGIFQPILGWVADGHGLAAAIQCLAAAALLGLIFSFRLSRRVAEEAARAENAA